MVFAGRAVRWLSGSVGLRLYGIACQGLLPLLLNAFVEPLDDLVYGFFNGEVGGVQDVGVVCLLQWCDGSVSVYVVAMLDVFLCQVDRPPVLCAASLDAHVRVCGEVDFQDCVGEDDGADVASFYYGEWIGGDCLSLDRQEERANYAEFADLAYVLLYLV